jgi:hypothetical protein
LDISPVAVELATDLAQRAGLAELCRFDSSDLDKGIPEGPPVDVLVCYFFRAPRLDDTILDRLKAGGLLAVAALSEVGPHEEARHDDSLGGFRNIVIIAVAIPSNTNGSATQSARPAAGAGTSAVV